MLNSKRIGSSALLTRYGLASAGHFHLFPSSRFLPLSLLDVVAVDPTVFLLAIARLEENVLRVLPSNKFDALSDFLLVDIARFRFGKKQFDVFCGCRLKPLVALKL